MPADYPLPRFHFIVEWGGTRIGFSEVTGLTRETQAVEYRDGSVPDYSPVKRPGVHKFSNITLKRGVVQSGSDFSKWLSSINHGKHDVTISLLDENQEPKARWKVRDAIPFKVDGPQLNAFANEVAIESIELTHEGFELEADELPGKPKKGRV